MRETGSNSCNATSPGLCRGRSAANPGGFADLEQLIFTVARDLYVTGQVSMGEYCQFEARPPDGRHRA
jgi:hypothetical protein